MRLGYFNPIQKLLSHADRIANWCKTGTGYPIMIEWFLSGSCNQRCNFCSFKRSHRKEFMDKKVVMRTIRELNLLGVKAINWTGGGEPLMHPDFESIARHTKWCGIQQGLFTNGSLLKPRTAKVIAETHEWVRFSIDAGMDSTYQEIRGVNEFKKVMDNLKLMVSVKGKCTVGAGFVITKQNFKDIQMFVNAMDYIDVDYIQFKPQIHPYFDDKQEEQEFWEMKVRPKLERASINPKVMVNLYKFTDLEQGCERPYDTCYGWRFCPCIASDGKVYRCNYLSYMPEHELGDLNTNTFAEIWEKQTDMKIVPQCQLLCKNDAINKALWGIKNGKHQNFL